MVDKSHNDLSKKHKAFRPQRKQRKVLIIPDGLISNALLKTKVDIILLIETIYLIINNSHSTNRKAKLSASFAQINMSLTERHLRLIALNDVDRRRQRELSFVDDAFDVFFNASCFRLLGRP